jgi:hypothetical protein
MVAFAALAGGASALASIAGPATSLKANKEALKNQKAAIQLEAEHAKQRAEIEDRQLVKSLNLAERQATRGIAEQEAQAFGAASEDKLAIQTDLDTANLSAAQRAAEIRRSLMSTLGEQRATLAARGVSTGSLSGTFDTEARTAAGDDLTVNEINRRMAEGGAAADVRGVDTSLANMRASNALGLLQQHQSAGAQLTMIREGTKNELRWQKEAADKGYSQAQQQTKYANAAALINGFAALAGTGYDFLRTYQATEAGPKEPVTYRAPKPLTTGSNSALRFSTRSNYGVR